MSEKKVKHIILGATSAIVIFGVGRIYERAKILNIIINHCIES